jgi:hypothetical protein
MKHVGCIKYVENKTKAERRAEGRTAANQFSGHR